MPKLLQSDITNNIKMSVLNCREINTERCYEVLIPEAVSVDVRPLVGGQARVSVYRVADM